MHWLILVLVVAAVAVLLSAVRTTHSDVIYDAREIRRHEAGRRQQARECQSCRDKVKA